MRFLPLPAALLALLNFPIVSQAITAPCCQYTPISTISTASQALLSGDNNGYEYFINFPSHTACTPHSRDSFPSPYLSVFISDSCVGLVNKFSCSDSRKGGLPEGVAGVDLVVDLLREGVDCVKEATGDIVGVGKGEIQCVKSSEMCAGNRGLMVKRSRVMSEGYHVERS